VTGSTPLPTPPTEPDALRAELAQTLGVAPDALADDTDLVDAGLDSIRVMALAERWTAGGIEVGFMDLVEAPTIGDWCRLLRDARATA